jgi:proteasome lid subunit RPN8/RPN11
MNLTLPQPVFERILQECNRQAPREAVGLLGAAWGKVDTVQAVAAAHNHSPTPEVAFWVEPYEQWRIERAFERGGMRCIGSFHSHPTKDAQPSGMDCEFMGDRIMLIVGFASATGADVRAWRSVDGATEEVELRIVPVEELAA